jgi:hypothetical protein
VPPFTVASLHTTITSRPSTRPTPAITPAQGDVAAVKPMRGERADLEKRRSGIEQPRHPVARQQLAAPDMPLARGLRSAQPVLPSAHRPPLSDLRIILAVGVETCEPVEMV